MSHMDARTDEIASLLKETGEEHHEAFLETDGADPDWAIWYASFHQEKLSNVLEAQLSRSDIVFLLEGLRREQPRVAPGASWPRFYAKALVGRYF